MRNDSKGKDIFYGVVAIATLIVAIIGATLAYFSVTASSNNGVVHAQAATFTIEYNDGQQVTAQADKLIPADFDVVKSVYEGKIKGLQTPNEGNACIDDNSQQVCSSYRFTVSSDAQRNISATLNNEHNGFEYLSYAVYDVTNGAWLTLSETENGSTETSALTQCSNENIDENGEFITTDDCYKIEEGTKKYSTNPNAINSIFGYEIEEGIAKNKIHTIAEKTTRVYDIVLFIQENNSNQNGDQGKQYNGTIVVEVVDSGMSGQITGFVNTTKTQ